MPDDDVRIGRVGMVAAVAVMVLLGAAGSAFWLLHAWGVPAGGEGGSAALIESIPAPRLQSAPQLDRAERDKAKEGRP